MVKRAGRRGAGYPRVRHPARKHPLRRRIIHKISLEIALNDSKILAEELGRSGRIEDACKEYDRAVDAALKYADKGAKRISAKNRTTYKEYSNRLRLLYETEESYGKFLERNGMFELAVMHYEGAHDAYRNSMRLGTSNRVFYEPHIKESLIENIFTLSLLVAQKAENQRDWPKAAWFYEKARRVKPKDADLNVEMKTHLILLERIALSYKRAGANFSSHFERVMQEIDEFAQQLPPYWKNRAIQLLVYLRHSDMENNMIRTSDFGVTNPLLC